MSTNFPPGDLRVSDADRDRAISELSEHFQAGRLTSEEFDERSGQALAARTGSDLEGLFADLPRPQPSASAMPQPSVNPGPPAPRISRPLLILPIAVVALAVAAGVLLSGHNGDHFSGGFIPLVIVALIIFRRMSGGFGRRGGRGGPW